MNDLITIELKGVRFFAFHGLYEEEKQTGNEFEMDLQVSYSRGASGTITGLEETINYVALFELVRKEMKQPRELLETLVMEITERLHVLYPFVRKIEIRVCKLNPPISQFTGKVGVHYVKEY